jgi:hypothetical protein
VRPSRSRITTTSWPFARLVLGEPPVDPIGHQVLRPDVTAEMGTVDLSNPSLTANAQRLHAGCHGFEQLVCRHERRLVLDIEFTSAGQYALAFDLVAEGDNGKQIGPQWQLVPGEQGTRGNGEISAARLAAPSRTSGRSRTRVAVRAAATRTDRSAVGVGPTQAPEHILHPLDGTASPRKAYGSRGVDS